MSKIERVKHVCVGKRHTVEEGSILISVSASLIQVHGDGSLSIKDEISGWESISLSDFCPLDVSVVKLTIEALGQLERDTP